ncbi:MAG TPA: hypothetical protein VF587_20205 [Solirubrobacteraceae bacterium]|jgi:hypothetical protein
MTNRLIPTLLAASVAALAAAGCGSDDESGSSTGSAAPAAETTAAPESAAPYGTYVRRLTAGDLKRTEAGRDEHGPGQQRPPLGEYRLVIAQGSGQDVLKVTDPGDFTVAMDLSAEGELLRLTSYVDPGQGAFCGPDVPASGRYAFKDDGGQLELEPAKPDPCADRDAILSGTWRKG